jgi:hypothetical protein
MSQVLQRAQLAVSMMRALLHKPIIKGLFSNIISE